MDIQYHAAWSNECIEFWFMLHFAYYTANNHRSEYKKFLNEKFQELGIGKYEKNMDNIFETLMNGGSPKLAIRYARRIIENGEGKTPAEIDLERRCMSWWRNWRNICRRNRRNILRRI